MKAYIVSLYIYSFLLITSLLIFPLAFLIWILTLAFDKKLWLLHRLSSYWATLYLWANPWWKIKIEDRHKINKNKACIMISNHQSVLDILVLYRLIVHFKWVSKIENFRIPIIGWNMRMNRYIKVERGNKISVSNMMLACKKNLRSGSSVMIFPEGTRSKNGLLGNFKEGAFTLARETKIPLLPILLDGTGNALPKKSFLLRKVPPFRIKVLDEIFYDPENYRSDEEFAAEIRNFMAKKLEDMRMINPYSKSQNYA